MVYVDESGDHSLIKINPIYPIFVLAFCVFKKVDYINQLVPALQNFKFKHFGHDQVVLHEADIRKDRGQFRFLHSKAKKDEFFEELSQIIADTDFSLICTVIRKLSLAEQFIKPPNPYHVALRFGLERVFYNLSDNNAEQKTTHIIVEKRGAKEDAELELEFRRICDGANYPNQKLPFEIVFSDKRCNSTGLQLADLVARPVGLKELRPDQPNRAFDILEWKFDKDGHGNVEGYGLKRYP